MTKLSIVIPALNAARFIEPCIEALREAKMADMEIIVADGGSRDSTPKLAKKLGANVIRAPRGRGTQLNAGAQEAKGEWLLFLHADTVLQPGWDQAVLGFINTPGNDGRAGYFAYRLDDHHALKARLLERLVALRCRLFNLPYGDQGLLMSRWMYDAIGGFRKIPLMEDVDIIDRIGRANLVRLFAEAVTSAERYRDGGYILRPLRNLSILILYFLGMPPKVLAKLYG